MEIKTDVEFKRSVRCQDVYTETGAEYVLPDYNGDVRKILFTDAEVRPSGKFAGGDEVEFSGIVVYNVIYSDAENNISSTTFTSDYEFAVKCSSEDYIDAIADTRVANYAIRLTGPRKISAKASIAGNVRLCENGKITVSGSAFADGESPEVLTKKLGVRNTKISETVEREYAEQVARLDGAIADEVSVIHTMAEAFADSVTASEGAVDVKGTLRLYAVIKNADTPAYAVEKNVTLDESIPFEGVSSDMKFLPNLTVTSLTHKINADDMGCEVVMNAIVEFSVVGEENEHIEVITDAYRVSCATENSYTDFSYGELVDIITDTENHTVEVPRTDMESEGLREMVLIFSSPKIESVEIEDGRAKISGEVKYSGIASELNDDGTAAYSSVKISSPFAKNVKLNCQNPEKTKLEARASAHSASASIDANKLYLSCALDITVAATCERGERILSASNIKDDEAYEALGSRVVVYYPDGSDTLFSVAKKFHTTALKVAADNSLTEAVSASGTDMCLSSVKKLLIL